MFITFFPFLPTIYTRWHHIKTQTLTVKHNVKLGMYMQVTYMVREDIKTNITGNEEASPYNPVTDRWGQF